MERRQPKEPWRKLKGVAAWTVVLGSILSFTACAKSPQIDVTSESLRSTPMEFLPTPTETATEIATPTQVPETATATATPTPTETPKRPIPIRNVRINGSSTVRNMNTDVLGGRQFNCDVIPPYCVTAEGIGGLRVNQLGLFVQTLTGWEDYQAEVFYDPQNSMTFDLWTGEETYREHRKTVEQFNLQHPDILVASIAALDTQLEDPGGRVQRERDDYRQRLIDGNGLGEIVVDARSALRQNGEPDPVCFNGDQLHVVVACQKRVLEVLKRTLDWWQKSGETLPVNRRLPLAP